MAKTRSGDEPSRKKPEPKKISIAKAETSSRSSCAPQNKVGALVLPEEIRAMFAEMFQTTLPSTMLPEGEVYKVGGHLYCSDKLRVGVIPCDGRPEKLPEGFYAIGFWGSGMSTYFTYCRADKWRRIYYRNVYSGAYADGEQCKNEIKTFLTDYCAFEEKLRSKVKILYLAIDISRGLCRFLWNDGEQQHFETTEPLDFLKLLPTDREHKNREDIK